MDYPPNVAAVKWFADEILPAIRCSVPAARFYIVGTNPTRDVRRLSRIPGVFVAGRVPDVRPYVAHATASVAPMRVARGIQNKVLEAMALARPVVLTSGALDGIKARPGQEVILADTAEQFAAACCRLAVRGDHDGIGAAARRFVVRNHDWSVTLHGFDDLLRLTGLSRSAGGDLALGRSGCNENVAPEPTRPRRHLSESQPHRALSQTVGAMRAYHSALACCCWGSYSTERLSPRFGPGSSPPHTTTASWCFPL